MKNHHKKAFTLIELLAVVTIIFVLTGLLVPALGQAREAGYKSLCLSNLRCLAMAFGMYQHDHNDIYPCSNDAVSDANGEPRLWMGRGFRPIMEPYIAPDLSESNPNILWCPSEVVGGFSNTSYGYSMSFYHSPQQINKMDQTSYTWSNPVPGVAISSSNVAMPGRKILAGEWYSNHQPVTYDYTTEPGWWSWAGARNFLFADGHVLFLPATKIRKANDDFPDPNLTVDGIEGLDI